ncbi:FepA family TonB-dependent siderophore receptor [Alteromonas pelagimontana]|uniref:FepA family TonB-dependent siderophore receptor n=1 Tax=Alteromonas pelagimontana TaxID=1858656 RepID=A0A6M4MCE7_9ALTE|nr:FepA family TonB-dependent siderophore receptor [Alteromonas pelagimontana]QJR80792.1 FepA family TonB-dependent siderophore receptor [Alteromonas pelagimontana]
MSKYGKIIFIGALFPMLSPAVLAQVSDESGELETLDVTVVQSAAEELKQAPGVSVITTEDIKRRPVTNDVAELIRTMPGVNLTGNSSTGQYGNKRQIDIRGMGPENTLILIDGKPVLSRNSVKMGRTGERDTRGDSNWVPAEAIESIEVIRGPAAARYGSGASGGVVNIITKKPDSASASVTLQTEIPDNSLEGENKRANVIVSGPLGESFSQRTILNYNKQDGDSTDLNREYTEEESNVAAGREGVENIDARTLVRFDQNAQNVWELEGAYSRQGNIYSGDNAFQGVDHETSNLYIGEETSVVRRKTLGLTHRGDFSFGDSFSYLQWEGTKNSRLSEGLAGGPEGSINTDTGEMNTIKLRNVTAKSEWNIPLKLAGLNQTMTLGAEYRGERQDDDSSNQAGLATADGVLIEGTEIDPEKRDPISTADLFGVYVEDNIVLTDDIMLTPGVRFDKHSKSGTNWSPSLNMSWQATGELNFQAGISRAFKAPNLYQLNPNYVYTTRGNGCPADYPNQGSGCSILGNPDLEHETSVNKELGMQYANSEGLNAGVTYFHNDYRNKIMTGNNAPEYILDGSRDGVLQVFRWANAPEAVIEGLEGNLLIPISDNIEWSTNATVMLESKNKATNQPLSIVPDYTINSLFSWQVTEEWELVFSAQHYGETESPTVDPRSGDIVENPKDRPSYTIFNANTVFQLNNGFDVTFSVKNLFDKSVKREGTTLSAGANTYNELGRSFLVAATYHF